MRACAFAALPIANDHVVADVPPNAEILVRDVPYQRNNVHCVVVGSIGREFAECKIEHPLTIWRTAGSLSVRSTEPAKSALPGKTRRQKT